MPNAQVKLTPTATMNYYLFPRPISLLVLLLLLSLSRTTVATTTSGSEHPPYKPLVAPVAKDPKTSLYTISIKTGAAPLVVDLAGSLVWSTCPSTHATVPCESGPCRAANQQSPRRCRYVDAGWFGANRDPGSSGCACTGHPSNPVTGECSIGDLTTMAMSANATDGRSTLYPVDLPNTVVGSCAPDRLLSSLPAGAAGVAGFSRRPLSLPSQLASTRQFGNKFALCLPGFALFGNSSMQLGEHLPDFTSSIPYVPLVTHPRSGAHYLPVKSISVSWDQTVRVALPAGALDLDAGTGRGGVALSSVTPYMAMRPDVYRPFIQAYDAAMRGREFYAVERVAAVAPFELCYKAGSLRPLKLWFGSDVPTISLELAGTEHAWNMPNANYMVFLNWSVACVGVVEMGRDGTASPAAVEDAPAVVLGGMQLENHLLVFDLDKGVLGFSDLIWYYMEMSCSAFNLI